MKSKKGGQFERLLCKQLSLWWTHGKRDDVFWRTAGSGARATIRQKQSIDTANQYGDILAVDPAGAPLIDLFTLELKRGYNKFTIMDAFDPNPNKVRVQQQWESYIQQAETSSENAGSFAWLVLQRRDDRDAVVWMPQKVVRLLKGEGCFNKPCQTISIFYQRAVEEFYYKRTRKVKPDGKIARSKNRVVTSRNLTKHERITGMLLSDFLERVSPEMIKQWAEEV